MLDSNSLIGMPWQLAKSRLQAAHIPFKVMIGGSFMWHVLQRLMSAYIYYYIDQ